MTHPSPSSLTRESVQECGRLPNQFQSLIPATAKPSLHSGLGRQNVDEPRRAWRSNWPQSISKSTFQPTYRPAGQQGYSPALRDRTYGMHSSSLLLTFLRLDLRLSSSSSICVSLAELIFYFVVASTLYCPT